MAEGPFSGKVALVTGAGSGIGRAAAIELARPGVAVGVLTRNEERVQAPVDEIIAAGGHAIPLLADVARQADLEGAVATIEQT